MEEYYDGDGTNRGRGAKDGRSFFIDVEAKKTTTFAPKTSVLVAVSSTATNNRNPREAVHALIGVIICSMGFLLV